MWLFLFSHNMETSNLGDWSPLWLNVCLSYDGRCRCLSTEAPTHPTTLPTPHPSTVYTPLPTMLNAPPSDSVTPLPLFEPTPAVHGKFFKHNAKDTKNYMNPATWESRSIPPWDLSFPFPHMKNSLGSTVPGQSKKHCGWIRPGMYKTVCLKLFFVMNFTYFSFIYLFFFSTRQRREM